MLQYFLKNPLFSLFPIEKPKFLNLTCCKIRQGHSRVIIYIHYDGQESPMLHTKINENRPASSGEDFLKGVYHIWAWWPSWSCDQHYVIRFAFPCTLKLSYKI